MIGYDTHGPQQPPEYDAPEFDLIHSEVDMLKRCDGIIEEYTEVIEGLVKRVFFRCADCNEDVTIAIINADRDTADWEHDYVR